MFCPNCGRKMENDEKYCIECGMPREGTIPSSDPQAQPQPSKLNLNQETPEEKAQANKLCLYSIGCTILGHIATGLYAALTGEVSSLVGSISSLLGVAGLILMIVVRVKYPKNTFGKVLMWIYIVYFIFAILSIIAAVILFAWFCYSCTEATNSGQSCG